MGNVMFSWIALVGSFGGGMVGAAIGALPAFAFAGVSVLVGVALALAGAEYDSLGQVAFGPVVGPHHIAVGADIITPLAGLATLDVPLVGGVPPSGSASPPPR
jgi:hypothetical protein